MVKTMTLTNQKIFELGILAIENFKGDIKFPAKAMFYIQKNVNTIVDLAKEIDSARTKMLARYGKANDDESQYAIPPENLADAQKELNDLLVIDQEVKIYTIKLEWLEGVELTPNQMTVLELMIEGDDENG